MWWAVDLLASEYGGGVREIREHVYPDELFFLTKKIQDRQVNNLLLQVRVASYPHSDDRSRAEFISSLTSIRSAKKTDKKLDKVGMEALKFAMSQNPRVIVK